MIKITHRDAISRARFFLDKSKEVKATRRNEFEAYLEAAIIFARAAIHRTKTRYEKHPAWKSWWERLWSNPSILFIKDERNWILKEGPPKIGQIVQLGQQPDLAEVLYYFDRPDVPATNTVAKHLDKIEMLVEEADELFSSNSNLHS